MDKELLGLAESTTFTVLNSATRRGTGRWSRWVLSYTPDKNNSITVMKTRLVAKVFMLRECAWTTVERPHPLP